MCGNAIRCVAKYLHDEGIVKSNRVRIETLSGIKTVEVYTQNGKVTSAKVDMGPASLTPASIPVTLTGDSVIGRKVHVGGRELTITCVSMGNPHAVIFTSTLDSLDVNDADVRGIGSAVENDPLFPERVNVEFIQYIDDHTLKMRVWERGSGETWACGTGACAAVVAAVENGLCRKGEDVTVHLPGGDLVINYTDERVTLTGNAREVYRGVVEM
jgi:carbamoyl-phosphate synthase large subunit